VCIDRTSSSPLRKRLSRKRHDTSDEDISEEEEDDVYYLNSPKRQRYQPQIRNDQEDPWTSDSDSDSPFIPSYAPLSYQQQEPYSPVSNSSYKLPSFSALLNESEYYRKNGAPQQAWSTSSHNGSSDTLNECGSPMSQDNPLRWLLEAAQVVDGRSQCL
jgi:hypothetical protein